MCSNNDAETNMVTGIHWLCAMWIFFDDLKPIEIEQDLCKPLRITKLIEYYSTLMGLGMVDSMVIYYS